MLRRVAQGLDNHAVVLRVKMSEKTLRNQVLSSFDRLEVRSHAKAIVFVQDKQSRNG